MMLLEALRQESNWTRTENGALTNASTLSNCLDLFASIGALRHGQEEDICWRFAAAYAENPDLAMKTLFYARDIRGGLGERRVFRVILQWLASHRPDSVRKNIGLIPEYGRWDDLLPLLDTDCEEAALDCIRAQLEKDREALDQEGQSVSLLAKWLPSVNASSAAAAQQGKKIARGLHLREREYRQLLSALRERIQIVENNLRTRDYTFPYEAVPSKAMLKYRKGFWRNDQARYGEFLKRVQRGEAAMHMDALQPYDIVRKCLDRIPPEEILSLDTAWKALEDFTDGSNALAVVDGSGSMYGCDLVPIAAAVSLGLYFAQHNQSAFHNHFITFSERPQLVKVLGDNIWEQVRYCMGYNEVANTNLAAVFDLILQAAVKHHIPQEEMPARLYILSDMEFDACVRDGDQTNFDYAKAQFAKAGYALPEVVFWNIASWNRQVPVTRNEQGVALVSGFSPRLFRQLAGGIADPYAVMLEILGQERYAAITA